tara:strand:+ start:1096 stop:2181 length:1086 start_codon:yes stop_codon:yes gene_type:complete
MFLKTYEKYIAASFLKNILLVLLVFSSLIFILNVLEEIKFFEKFNIGLYYPILLTLLNLPSTLFEIFPFIFLISSQLIFLNFFEKDELIIFKNHGLKNIKIIIILISTSLILGVILCSIFYTFSSKMKHSYLSFKNKFTDDNKYLAVVNENGLWIKDEINNSINIINAFKFRGKYLDNVTIAKHDLNFNLKQTLLAEKVNIEKNEWILENVTIIDGSGLNKEKVDKTIIQTNFNQQKISNLFSNLSSLNLIELLKLQKDYKSLGYSTSEVETYLHKLYSIPIYLAIMTSIASILMFNIKYNKSKIFHIILGILLSVSIYYINYFFNLLGTNDKIPTIISIWLPNLILFLFCIVGLININEK